MNDETGTNLLEDVAKESDEENNFLRNQKLEKQVDIFLMVFIVLVIGVVSFTS